MGSTTRVKSEQNRAWAQNLDLKRKTGTTFPLKYHLSSSVLLMLAVEDQKTILTEV